MSRKTFTTSEYKQISGIVHPKTNTALEYHKLMNDIKGTSHKTLVVDHKGSKFIRNIPLPTGKFNIEPILKPNFCVNEFSETVVNNTRSSLAN